MVYKMTRNMASIVGVFRRKSAVLDIPRRKVLHVRRGATSAEGAGISSIGPFGVFFFDSLTQPHFDDRLSRDSDEVGLTIQLLNHPNWQININSLLIQIGPAKRRHVQIGKNVFLAFIKDFIQFFCFHNIFLPPDFWPAARKSIESCQSVL